MPYARPEALVSPDWLAAHLADPHVRVLDSSYKQPGITPTPRQDYDAGHIPGAVFFDIHHVPQPAPPLPDPASRLAMRALPAGSRAPPRRPGRGGGAATSRAAATCRSTASPIRARAN